MRAERPTVVYVASTASVLASFWRPLMRRMVAGGWRVLALTPRGPAWARLDEPGIEHRAVAIERRIGAARAHSRALAQLYAVYRDVRPGLVHHVTVNPVIYGSLAARAAGVPCIVNSLPGLGAVFGSTRWDARPLRAWITQACRVALRLGHGRTIVQNGADREFLVGRRIASAERVVLVRGTGVDLERFRPQPEPAGEPVVLLCARMLWSKGVGDLIEAARLLRQRGLACRVLLVGPCEESHRDGVPAAQLQRWQAEGVASWLGMREDMPALYASSHVVALPTRYGEGVPSVLVEAAASARAVVAYDTPGCREVVRQAQSGFLVPSGDIAGLGDALQRLVNAPALRAAMGWSGRQIAEAEFGQERIVDEVVALYDGLRSAAGERQVA